MANRNSLKPRAVLRILATSDVHGVLASGEGSGPSTGGLSRIATLVEALREQSDNCLLLDNGDFLQGTPLCDFVAAGDISTADGHPVIRAMNYMRYDAVGLGNHEFDYGLPFLKATLQKATFPVIGTNVSCDSQPWRDQIVLEHPLVDQYEKVHLVKIGLFSVMPEQVVAWNGHLKDQLATRDITQAAVDSAKALRETGAQVVIAMAHSGIGDASAEVRQENAAIPIAMTADIDAIICGHTHQQLPDAARAKVDCVDFPSGQICGVPAVMPGSNGAFLGEISLELEFDQGRLGITAARSKLHPTAPQNDTYSPKQDPVLVKMFHKHEIDSAALQHEQIGYFDLPIHSYYARLPGDSAVALVAQAQLDYAQRELEAHLPKGIPVLSAASPFKSGGRGGPDNFVSIPKGPVTRFDLNDLHPFQNTLVAKKIAGGLLQEWLEMSVSCFNQIHPGTSDNQLRDMSFPCYGFDTVFGVTYAIDLTQPARYNVLGKQVSSGHRIKELCLRGMPVNQDQTFIMLTTSYRAGGGGNFPNVHACTQLDIPTLDCRALLADFIAGGVTSSCLPPSPWRFSPIPDASAWADIGPGALPYVAQGHLPDIEISAGSINDAGFVPFAVKFPD